MKSHSRRFVGAGLAGLVLIALAAVFAVSATITWNDGTGSWNVPANWNPNTLPGAVDDVVITDGIAGPTAVITHNTGTDTIHTLSNAETVVVNGGSSLAISAGGTNTGTIQAGGLSAGTLHLNGGTLTNTGGTLAAGDSGVVSLSGVTILNGTLTTSGSGVITTPSGGAVQNAATLNGVTIAAGSRFVGADNSQTILLGTITNNGTMALASTGPAADFYLGGDATLAGSGVMTLSNNLGNRIWGGANSRLTNSAGHRIEGAGQIGVNYIAITNEGLIVANQPTPLVIYPGSGGMINTGTLRAANGATLQLYSRNVDNTGGTIEAQSGSTVQLVSGAVILNGTLTTSGSGVITTPSGGAVQNAATLNGVTIAAGSRFVGADNSQTILLGTITNNGTMALASTGPAADFYLGGDATLAGSGVMTLSNNLGNRIWGGANSRLTNSAGHRIEGAGQIGVNYIAITNEGLIVANQPTPLVIDPGSNGVTNTGTLQVNAGSTLRVTDGLTNFSGTTLTGGTYIVYGSVGNLGTMSLANANIVTNAATIVLDGSNAILNRYDNGTDALANFAVNAATGRFTIRNGRNIATAGAFSNAGVVTIGDLSLFTANGVFTNTGELQLRGGVFTASGYQLTNSGSINGFGTLDPLLVGNAGSMIADGGTLAVSQISGNGGTVQSNPGATLQVLGPASAGTLINNGSLSLSSSGITVYTDYRNANFGAGNSFRARANVLGTGLILASGDVGLSLSGAGISGGTTATPTLALGNVHAGVASSGSFNINNTGTTGPVLRGAVQNTGITVPGLGVTAQNYGPVALGGSETVSYTYTPAAGGVLSGQTFNVVTNFDNVPGKTVTVTGAAYNLAIGSATPSRLDFANQRVGGTATQALIVTNAAPAGSYTEGLSANFGTAAGAAQNVGGPIIRLAGGASDSGTMGVRLDTSAAGAKTGSVTLHYVSDGTGTSGLGVTELTSQTINVSGHVYQVAQPTLTSSNIAFTNRHVGDAATQSLTMTNTSAALAGYQEGLNASFSGASSGITGSGTIVNLAQGASSTALAVGIDTSTAGAKSGTATLALASNGTGTSGLTELTLAPQTVNVSGSVYRLANAVINNAGTFSFGNVHVGDTVQQALSITNSAANDGYSERLNAGFGGATDGRITTSGSIAQLAAGATNASSMVLGVNTAAAGAVNGMATVNFASDGTGTSGLGITVLPSQSVTVTATIEGGVYRLASPVIQTAQPVNFGNVRIGTAVTPRALSILNSAPNDGYSERLNASANGTTGGVTAGGSFTLLAPQGVNSTAIQVGLDTSVAGNRGGAATITFQSDGTGTSGLGITALPSQNVQVTGNVYRLANPALNTPSVTLAARVGDAGPTASIGLTNSSPDVYTEGLNVTRGATAAGFTSSGGIGNLAAGQTSSLNAIQVALNTGTAGSFSGTQALAYVSTGAGTTSSPDVSVGSGSVTLAGRVYTPAVASVNTTPVDFGIVHVGDVVAARNVAVTNAATATALNDVLVGTINTGGSSSFSAAGDLGSGLGAGQTNNTSLNVQLNTSIAGIYNGAANLALSSHNADMADLPLATTAVALSATVNNYANPVYNRVTGDGTLSGGGLSYTLDFGEVVQNAAAGTTTLRLLNSVVGPADLLEGSFTFDVALFGLSGFNSFTGLGAGQGLDGLIIAMNTDSLGTFSETITLHAFGYNAGGYRGAFDVSLLVRGSVVDGSAVPEPSSIILIGLGLAGLAAVRRKFRG